MEAAGILELQNLFHKTKKIHVSRYIIKKFGTVGLEFFLIFKSFFDWKCSVLYMN